MKIKVSEIERFTGVVKSKLLCEFSLEKLFGYLTDLFYFSFFIASSD